MSKTKLYIYSTDDQKYLNDELEWCLTASTDGELGLDHWNLVGETEVTLEKNIEELKSNILRTLNAKETEMLASLELLNIKKKELMSIEYVPS